MPTEHKRIYLSPPHMSGLEQVFVQAAIDSNWIAPLGPHVDAFEREMAERIGVAHTVALSSGTAALHLAMILSNVGQGNEVLCSTFTFAASANAITYVGAIPVFIDSTPMNWNMDPSLLAEAIENSARRNRTPKAAVIVDLYGQCADYEVIEAKCREYDITLIEDAAEALGAMYNGRAAGSFGRMAAFSFNGNKIITTSGGGMLVSNDEALIRKACFLASQARDPAPYYQHSEIGYNYRMSNVLAAIGRAQLKVLSDHVEARRRIFKWYKELLGDLPGIKFMPEATYGRCTRWLTCLLIDSKHFGATCEEVRIALETENIESRPLWKPLHLQPVFSGCRVIGGRVSEELFKNGLCLPSGSALTRTEVERIAGIVRQTCRAELSSKIKD